MVNDELVRLTDSPVDRLNRAVAVGEADGPLAGMAALGRVPTTVPRWTAVSAHLHERAGQLTSAAELYSRASAQASNAAERDHLLRQSARLHRSPGGDD